MPNNPKINKKQLAIILCIILIFTAYVERGKIFKSVPVKPIDPEAEKASLAEIECITAAQKEYFEVNSKLLNEESQLMIANQNNVSVVIEERRLSEAECIKEATCGYISSNKVHNQMMFDTEFSSCLDENSKVDDAPDPDPPSEN